MSLCMDTSDQCIVYGVCLASDPIDKCNIVSDFNLVVLQLFWYYMSFSIDYVHSYHQFIVPPIVLFVQTANLPIILCVHNIYLL